MFKFKKRKVFSFFFALVILFVVLGKTLTKKINNNEIKIIDGDTIHIGKIKYRLHGIDSPEKDQLCKFNNQTYLCGVESTNFLKLLIKDSNNVYCNEKSVDRYKRIVAVCFYDGKELNKIIVRNGWAIAYRKFSNDYVSDENYAKDNKLGIWRGSFSEPYLWRKMKKNLEFKE